MAHDSEGQVMWMWQLMNVTADEWDTW